MGVSSFPQLVLVMAVLKMQVPYMIVMPTVTPGKSKHPVYCSAGMQAENQFLAITRVSDTATWIAHSDVDISFAYWRVYSTFVGT